MSIARNRLTVRLAGAALIICALCVTASVAGAKTAGRRPPTGGIHFQGVFHRALWGGDITIATTDDGTAVFRVQGILPGTCRDRRDGRLKHPGPDGAIGLIFDVQVKAPIHPNGSFALTARNASGEDLDPATLTIRGTFYGSNILGSVTGRTTGISKSPNHRYSHCTGAQPFWARRQS